MMSSVPSVLSVVYTAETALTLAARVRAMGSQPENPLIPDKLLYRPEVTQEVIRRLTPLVERGETISPLYMKRTFEAVRDEFDEIDDGGGLFRAIGEASRNLARKAEVKVLDFFQR